MNFCKFNLIILAAGFFLPATLFAQTRCPTGVQAGSAQCLPDDDQGSAPPRPTGEWIDAWGAIATSPTAKGGGGGVSSNQLSKEDAENVALQNCKNTTGEQNCKVDFVYHNQCVAFVAQLGGHKVIMYGAPTIKKAVDLAMADCKALPGGRQCMVKVSECSYPKFKKY